MNIEGLLETAGAWILIGAFIAGIYAVAIRNEGKLVAEHFDEFMAIAFLWPFWALFTLGVVFADRVLHLFDKERR